jgi:xanthine dehydrogenase accessory factor
MRDILPDLDAWTADGDDVAVAMVVGVKRSAPRPPGAKMAVSSSGAISGAVSGGCVEGSIVLEAEELLADPNPAHPGKLLHFGIADEEAWDVGLPCGGEIDVWIQRHEDDGLAAIARAGGRGAQVTRLDTGARLLVDA